MAKLVNALDFDSSIPLFESECRSQYLGVVQLGERLFWEQEVAGAKPATQTNSSYMRNRMVDKSAEACSSQMRLVFAERPNEFVGEVQHVDNKRIPVEYHEHNTPINDAYPVMKKFDHLPLFYTYYRATVCTFHTP